MREQRWIGTFPYFTAFSKRKKSQETLGETNMSSELQPGPRCTCEKEPEFSLDLASREANYYEPERLKSVFPPAWHAHQGQRLSSGGSVRKRQREIPLLVKVKASSKEALIDRDLFMGPPGYKVHCAYVHGGLV